MKLIKVKCPVCYDHKLVSENVLIPICNACIVQMIMEEGDDINKRTH